jgi:CubicO group peptidase (beta-lactamase class C family)
MPPHPTGYAARAVLLVAAVALPGCAAQAARGTRLEPAAFWEGAARYADSLFRAHFPAGEPGAAVAVIQDGRVVHRGFYGVADLAAGRAIDSTTTFYLASVSKPFTALAVQLLVREGRLRYDDRLVDRLPELAATDSAITVRHLLTHTSGLPDYNTFIDWPRFRGLDDRVVIDTLRAHPRPKFPPGSRYEYTNSGYVVLARLVERATGTTYAEFLRRRVFEPAGMRSALVYDGVGRDISRRARGYHRAGGRFLLSDQDVLELPDGREVRFTITTTGAQGVFATLDDLVRWDAALSGSALLSPAEWREAFTPRVPAEGQSGVPMVLGVGYGWFVSRRYGTEVVWHDGSHGGRRSIVLRVPGRRLSVIVLSNRGEADPVNLATMLADRFLGGPDG